MDATHPGPARLHPDDLRGCFPRPVGVGLRREGDGLPLELAPEEEALLSPRAVPRRRLLFALGRAAARAALRELGVEPRPIARGPGGEPLWPPGVVGSIAHSGGVAVAVAGRAADYAGLGVDLERLEPGLSEAAARLVGTPAELAWCQAACDGHQARLRRTLLFSAKEAVFKALYPAEGVRLGFHDAELTWREACRAFQAVLLRPAGAAFPAGFSLPVRCLVFAEEVLSATWV